MTADPVLAQRSNHRGALSPGQTRRSTRWRDELVELLVLAEHGDGTAAARIRDWVATDSAAHAVYRRIAGDLESMRAP